jgi:hypothetical protein
MTQHNMQSDAIDRAWNRIKRSDWDQLVWFANLARTDLGSLSAADRLNLCDEFIALNLESTTRSGAA